MKKKMLSLFSAIFAILCVFPISAFAAESDPHSVSVSVEYVEEDLSSQYDFTPFSIAPRRGTVDLSKGNNSFSIGILTASGKYTTSTYSITKGTIRIGLQSLSAASEHIRITLYKSNGSSVATHTVSVPWSNPTTSGITTYVSFTNLDANLDYYAVIENIDSVQSGSLLGVAMQK